jgi:DNA-binding HxlR family transcriptional regulator
MDQMITDLSSRLDIRKAAMANGETLDCPVRDVIQGISGIWVPPLLMALEERPHRFGELRRLLADISQRMLTQTLHDLQRDGYVHRKVLPTNPPSVEYSLSPLGNSLFGKLRLLLQWAELNHHAVRKARDEFDGARVGATTRLPA